MTIFGSYVEPLIDIFILINGRAIKLKWHFCVNAKEAWKAHSLEKYSCCYSKHGFGWSTGRELSLAKS